VVTGNISHQIIVDISEQVFSKNVIGTQKNSSFSAKNISEISPVKELILKKQFQQSHICLGTLCQGFNGKNRYAHALSNIIFGDGMSSRLYQVIREKYGYAYSIFSFIQNYINFGE
jgi:predicted Zn-dependent peptidase